MMNNWLRISPQSTIVSAMTETHSEFRDRFPVLSEMDFFNHAGVAPISGPAADALRAYAEQASTRGYLGSGWYKRAKEVKAAAAKLIGARGEQEIAFIPNTSTGLAQVAAGLDWQEGDNVIITGVEFPANRYPWEDLKRRGVKLIQIPQRPDGRIDPDEVADAVTNSTRVVAISHVQYATGHRIDLRPISEMVHHAGGYLCVDAIQSVGALPVDVREMGIDFLAADGHKWMLGPEGCGIFYCDEDLAWKLHPPVIGWMNMTDAFHFGDYRFELQSDARRFEPGTWNIPGILAMGASIDLLLEVGIDEVWSRISTLTSRLVEGLTERGWEVLTPWERPEERSGIVVFAPPEGGPAPAEVAAELKEQQIEIAVREGRLRVSPHFYNEPEQIDRLLEALGAGR